MIGLISKTPAKVNVSPFFNSPVTEAVQPSVRIEAPVWSTPPLERGVPP